MRLRASLYLRPELPRVSFLCAHRVRDPSILIVPVVHQFILLLVESRTVVSQHLEMTSPAVPLPGTPSSRVVKGAERGFPSHQCLHPQHLRLVHLFSDLGGPDLVSL